VPLFTQQDKRFHSDVGTHTEQYVAKDTAFISTAAATWVVTQEGEAI